MATCKHPQTGRFFAPTDSQCGIVVKADDGVILRNLARALAGAVLHAARIGKAPRGLYVYACDGDPIIVRV
jgi:hypothetical protein